jgi:hypothetical protein
MRTLVLTLALLLASPAFADDMLLQRSIDPTCQAVGYDQFGLPIKVNGYATVRRSADGNVYERDCDFMGDHLAGGLSDIGMPVDGFPNNAGRGGTKLENAKVLPNGMISLR